MDSFVQYQYKFHYKIKVVFNLIFKINSDEMLLINIPEASFANAETPDGSPRIVSVSSTNQIIYRIYSATVTSTSICN
jgi:hypothetical protein